ncbi:B3 domain-containing protein, DNA-binding pseudobarrel domain protein [Tanacetum coccineum]
MGNKVTRHDHKLTNNGVPFAASKPEKEVNDKDEEEEYYRLKIEELVNEKLKLFGGENINVSYEWTESMGGSKRKGSSVNEVDKKKKKKKKVKMVVDKWVVSDEVITQLKEFITSDEINGLDMKLVIQKSLYQSDLVRAQNRLNMPFNQVETHDFLTPEEKRILGNDSEIKVQILGPNLQMYKKPMWLKIWSMMRTKNYVLKTNWYDFVQANKSVLKEKTTIQIWSFRKDGKLCFAVVCVDKPVVNTTLLEDASSAAAGSSLIL